MRYERGGGRRDFNARSFAPVKVGDELDVKIEAVGEKGDGIAKKDGFVLFVAGTKQGDEVKIKITRVLQKVGFAEVVGKSAEGESKSESSEESQEEGYDSSAEPSTSQDQESDEEYSGQDSENFGEDNQNN